MEAKLFSSSLSPAIQKKDATRYKNAPSGIRTRVSRLGSVNANHYTNSAHNIPFLLCKKDFSWQRNGKEAFSHQSTMGSGGKTKAKRGAHAAKRFGKRMRSIKNRSKDLDQIQVFCFF